VEATFFLMALHRCGPTPRRRPIPRTAPPGFRRTSARSRMRLFFRNAGVRARKAGIVARIGRLIAALADPEPHIAYFFKRICDGLRVTTLIAAAPPAHALAIDAPRAAVIADSS
jgi:hypothetical protein